MNPVDIILIIAVIAAVAFAVYLCIRSKKKGRSCCGDCRECQKRHRC